MAKHFLISTAVLLPIACSSSGGNIADHARIVPEGLSVTALAGGNGVLDVIALTLRAGPNGTELYVAVRNDGAIPACSAAVAVELFDENAQSMAAGVGGLLSQHFYRLRDGSGSIAACVAPGDVTMTSVPDLPSDIAIERVKTIVYRCPYFALDVTPIAGLSVDHVKSTTDGAGTLYTGTLVNGLDVAVSNPSISVFSINGVGRPLGVATGSSTVEIPPGGSWAFETNSVDAPAVNYAAYPAGALAN